MKVKRNLNYYSYSTKRVWIKWKNSPNVVQPFGYFYSIIDAIDYITNLGYNLSDYIFESSDITILGSDI